MNRQDGRALAGIRVLDLSRVLAGPYCTMLLADLGAEVIKVEQPGAGDETRSWGPPFKNGHSAYFLCVNRNKRSMTLNLRHPEGVAVVKKLAGEVDVLVENFRVGFLDGLGLGYAELSQLNPGLIYCSISGYGPTGPYAALPGYDFIIQGTGGLMSITGEADGPPVKVGVAIVDLTAGMMAAYGILAGLRFRDRTGRGQKLDISLLHVLLGWLANQGSNYLVGDLLPGRMGNDHPNIAPYRAFKARDRYFNIAVGNDKQWVLLCRVIGRPEWIQDARFRTNGDRVVNREILAGELGRIFTSKTADEWIAELKKAGVPCGPINDLSEVFSDPHVRATDAVVTFRHPEAGAVKVVGNPLRFSETPPRYDTAPPLLGQHTREILADFGFEGSEIHRLAEAGVI